MSTLDRLNKVLKPARVGEEEAIEVAARGFNADLLATMIERTAKRAYLAGVESGTKKLVQVVMDQAAQDWEHARAHDMAQK